METKKTYHNLNAVVICLALLLMVTTLVPIRTVQANESLAPSNLSTPVTVYGDSLAAGWQDWSWNANRTFNNTSPIHSGSASIAITITQAWGALYLHGSPALSTAGYTNLEFYVNGGTSGNQPLAVQVNGNSGSRYYFTATKSTWVKVSIPLTQVGSPASITDIYWQDAGGKSEPVFYLDDIALVSNSVATAVPTATSTVVNPTPSKTNPPNATATTVPTQKPSATGTVVPTNKPTSTATTRPTATSNPGSTTHFNTLPPGSVLPSDAECAAQVKVRAENKRMNKTANATAGNQHLASDFFGTGADDPRANTIIAARVTGNYTGTTDEILQWAACKWGIDEDIVRAQAALESWWQQTALGDFGSTAANCAPGHAFGVDGQPGLCPESFGIVQNRYPYEKSSWPGIQKSTAFNADTGYAEMRACYEGYEWWLNSVDHGSTYVAGDLWGCIGRWYAGRWHTSDAEGYITRVQGYLNQRIWETSGFQEP